MQPVRGVRAIPDAQYSFLYSSGLGLVTFEYSTVHPDGPVNIRFDPSHRGSYSSIGMPWDLVTINEFWKSFPRYEARRVWEEIVKIGFKEATPTDCRLPTPVRTPPSSIKRKRI